MAIDNRKIRILCVDDHPLVRQGLASVFQGNDLIELVAEASTGEEALRLFDEHRPDVTLVDLRLPAMSGIELIVAIRSKYRDAKIVVLTTESGDVQIQRALAAGAQGYVLKGMAMAELVGAIRAVHSGRSGIPGEVAISLVEHLADENLSPRETDVLRAIARGHRNKQVAANFGISEETIKMHVKNIFVKLGATDRTHAVTIAIQRGIISL
ncbi:MAG: DNA-binding response regulator [Alphaproteobacteria bacterium]|jgi:DNA-binding NarL/FixJ family response regulator|nr:DNA-binding response regulator [Alphaproteobacteria bacterium]